jgi:hypothetical protein
MAIREVGWDDTDRIPFTEDSDHYWALANSYEALESIK